MKNKINIKMKVIKQCEVHLNIPACEVYSGITNPDFIKNKLIEIYEGRCFNSCLIHKITKVIEHSDYYCTKSRDDGSSDIDVLFETEAFTFTKGTILSGCEIAKIETTGQLICMLPNAVLRIGVNRVIQNLGEKSYIPIVVSDASYPICKNKVTIIGEVYSPQTEIKIYKLTNQKLSENDLKQLTYHIDSIKSELSLIDTLIQADDKEEKDEEKDENDKKSKKEKTDKKEKDEKDKSKKEKKEKNKNKQAFDYFSELFYPYKKQLKLNTTPILNLLEENLPECIISHPAAISDVICSSEKELVKIIGKNDKVLIVNENALLTFQQLLFNYLNKLILIRNHVELFPDYKERNKKVWQYYENRKID